MVVVTTWACGNADGCARHDQPGDVGHVCHQQRRHFVGDLPELGEVDLARVRAIAAQDHLRPQLAGLGPHAVEVDGLGGRVQLVVVRLVEDGGGVELHPVRQVPAAGQVQRDERLARLHDGHERRQVGVGAAVRLHVGMPAAEHLPGPFDGQAFHLVVELAPAVVSRARISLGILVGQHRSRRFAHRGRDVVLAGDQLQRRLLPPLLAGDQLGNPRVGVLEAHPWSPVCRHSLQAHSVIEKRAKCS